MALRTVFDLTAEQKDNAFTFLMPMRSPTKSDTGVLIRSITGKKPIHRVQVYSDM